ncbi:hypothetical protein K469DRAFT_690132 [Zopfia rhizophila CBS 207.26]|uniref:NACHT domain-containing protein n=1 Tax=Zopfia rhizophila CBS 207.26 TaxID=1314779 RepID=A0A6A6DYE1_9PEZI|nr:hypothetical protein K469DRAFT_690132 [Zopfia rhizophila CBS 207.26]
MGLRCKLPDPTALSGVLSEGFRHLGGMLIPELGSCAKDTMHQHSSSSKYNTATGNAIQFNLVHGDVHWPGVPNIDQCLRPLERSSAIQMLRSAIDGLNLDQFLRMLSVVDQDEHISAIPPLDRDHPMFYWIFKNEDFVQWNSPECSQVLWLSGPPERMIHQVASHVWSRENSIHSKTDHFVLHLFCSAGIKGSPIVGFVHTFLNQIVYCSPADRRLSIIQSFLRNLLDEAFKKEAAPSWKERGFNEGDSPDKNLQKLLDVSENELLTALRSILDEEQRGLSVVIDGLDKVGHQRGKFIEGVRAFVERLQQRTSKVKILLTSRPLSEIKDLLYGLPYIEYDRERKASLHFDNTRHDKISGEHQGSFEWIWAQDQYRNWSTSDASRLLYIQGKPGSGKSTLTKYFGDHLRKREPAAKSAVVAKFFYSYREGELERSHYNMLRSILYDILDQDEAFFYHRFQTEYRSQRRGGLRVDWDYASLKTVFKSLRDHSLVRRLYLIIDAVDESEDNDRREILDLLFELSSNMKHCILKVFIASRPVGQLEVRRDEIHGFIRLQDETIPDITRFAHSFLVRLNLTRVLAQATEYIVENAQGVFLWVKLVREELLACKEQGYSEEEFIEFLKGLPRELEAFYTLMFERMNTNKSNLRNPRNLQDLRNYRDLQVGIKMFRFVLFARRPLTVDELRHALIIPDNLGTKFTASDDSLQEHTLPSEQRIIYGGGHFLEIKLHHGGGIVQVMHQTVREFFLNPEGRVANSEFALCEKDAHVCIAITCIRYLMLCAANTSLVGRLPDIESWTSEHYEVYAQYLNIRPLANYALCYLKHHIDGGQQDENVQSIVSQFIAELADNPAAYLLESWVGCSRKGL